MKSFLKAFSEGISISRENKQLVYQTVRKYMKVEDRKLLEVMVEIPLPPGPESSKALSSKKALSIWISRI